MSVIHEMCNFMILITKNKKKICFSPDEAIAYHGYPTATNNYGIGERSNDTKAQRQRNAMK